MDILAQEIARKRKANAEAFGGEKYVKRGHLNAVREARLRAEEAAEADAKRARASTGASASASANSAAADALAVAADEPLAVAADEPLAVADEPPAASASLDALETIRRLRAIGHPATLFGEDQAARLARLELAQASVAVEDEHAGGQQANERQKELQALEEYARRLREKVARAARGGAAREGDPSDPTSSDVIVEGSAPPGSSSKPDAPDDPDGTLSLEAQFASAAAEVARRVAPKQLTPAEQTSAYFKDLLGEWEREIGERPETLTRTEEGRRSVANCRLCRAHMKPLHRRIKNRELPGDIERALFLIVKAMRARDYRAAADAYVGIAIGNAAWPIGVTMVGIHERSAREKIGAQTQAHAMHDEETRKYLQSVKRLITFAQRLRPSAPSLSLDFNSGYNGSDKEALVDQEEKRRRGEGRGGEGDPLLALPSAGEGDDRRGDGGRSAAPTAPSAGNRKWKNLLTRAYDGEEAAGGGAGGGVISTAKDAVLARDKTMYDDKSGHLK